jgi:hypothetical protein
VRETPIIAANARVDDIHPTDTPAWPALFDREALAGANRELHRTQVSTFEKITPPLPEVLAATKAQIRAITVDSEHGAKTQVRMRLSAGGSRIRTIGSWMRNGASIGEWEQ